MPSPQSLVGSYRRYPTENDYHKAVIRCDNDELTWHNDAGQVWTLRLEDNSLYIDESCPFYQDGVRLMDVQLEGDVVVGVEFMGDVYACQEDSGPREIVLTMPTLQERLEGRYQREPVENQSHVVNLLEGEEEGVLKWEDDAGGSWSLRVSDDDNVLLVGEDCPVFADGHTQVLIKREEDNIVGLEFMGDLYAKADAFGGEDESECAICEQGPEDVFGPEDDASADGL